VAERKVPKLTEKEVMAMRSEVFEKVKDPKRLNKIISTAFAYGLENDDIPYATDMMAWYLVQDANKDKLDNLYMEFVGGYEPENGSSPDGEQEGA